MMIFNFTIGLNYFFFLEFLPNVPNYFIIIIKRICFARTIRSLSSIELLPIGRERKKAAVFKTVNNFQFFFISNILQINRYENICHIIIMKSVSTVFLYVRVHNCPVHFVSVWWWHNARPDTSSNQQYSVEVPNFCVSTVIFHFCYTFQRAPFFVVIHVLIY